MSDKKPTGRLLGGLLHVRQAITRERVKNAAWTAAGGVTGSVIGLIFITAYLAYR